MARRRASIGRRLAFAVIAVGLFFGASEVSLRALDLPEMDEGAQFAHASVYWQYTAGLDQDPTFHRELNVEFPISTDQNGLRPPFHDVDKPDGTFRIMTMGCSTTFGWGVDDASTYPYQLEQILRDNGHAQVEVINGGQPGYTTFQGMWLWDKVLADYEPDLVLLGFIVQDSRKAAYSDLSQALMQGEADFLKSNVLYSWHTYLMMMEMTGKVRVRTKERSQTEPSDGVYRVSEQEYLDNLRSLRASIEAAGGQAAHMGYPLEVVGYTEQHRRLLKLEAQSAGLPHFDPSDTLARESGNRTLYFPQDRGHANADGNRLIAELVAGWLIDEGLVK